MNDDCTRRIEPGLRKVIDPGKDWTSAKYHAVINHDCVGNVLVRL
jgi:hypothetical protein